MRVVITGGAGFLGQRLARALLAQGTLDGPHGSQPITRLVLVDVVAPPRIADSRVEAAVVDIADQTRLADVITSDTSAIFHLAAIVSGMAEADFDLGMRINLDATRALLELCRGHGAVPRLVFTSSVAVYGGDLPAVVTDTTPIEPRTSYGTEKAAAELLITDYTRRGWVDGRSLRLPTITVRPGRPNAAASSFASGVIREPLNGEASVCPVSPDTRMWVASPEVATRALIRGCELESAAIGSRRAINVPGLSVTVGGMVDALGRVCGPDVAARVTWTRDPRIAQMVATWPGEIDVTRAQALGFAADVTFDDIIHQYLANR